MGSPPVTTHCPVCKRTIVPGYFNCLCTTRASAPRADLDLNRIRDIARAATAEGKALIVPGISQADAEHVAATCPGVVLALLELARPPASPADLEALLATARAAKEEVGSGTWFVPTKDRSDWLKFHSDDVAAIIPDDDRRVVAVGNRGFPVVATTAHIAAACPDVVIALVERLQAAEATRDNASASLAYVEERDGRVLRDLFARCDELRDAHGQLEETAARLEAIEARHAGRPLTFDELCATRLADEVAVLVRRGVIDSRSPAADALLDFRDPPSTARADRLAQLEDEIGRLQAERDQLRRRLVAIPAEPPADLDDVVELAGRIRADGPWAVSESWQSLIKDARGVDVASSVGVLFELRDWERDALDIVAARNMIPSLVERTAAAESALAAAREAEQTRLGRMRPHLQAIRAAAHAARRATGARDWMISPEFERYSEGEHWTCHDVLLSGTAERETVAENCSPDVAAFIAVMSPDATLALVEQLAEVQAKLEEVAAERDASQGRAAQPQTTPLPSELEGWEGQRAALLAEVGTLRAQVADASREMDGTRAEMRTLRRHRDLAEFHLERMTGLTDVMLGVIERQGARVALRDADIIGRDRALDACAERIADLLGQCWPATLGRNLAMGGALSMARFGGIRLADGYWDWQPGRGKPHPSINDEPEEG